jgi:hypothetical protein
MWKAETLKNDLALSPGPDCADGTCYHWPNLVDERIEFKRNKI